MKNLERYQNDLDKLISDGEKLSLGMQFETNPERIKASCEQTGRDYEACKKIIPRFRGKYQIWYTEALSVIQLIIPNRGVDFIGLYKIPKVRKMIDWSNYVIEDYLHGTSRYVNKGLQQEEIVGPKAAIPKFEQQLNILKSAKKRFESSLFDIKTLVEADLFDSELDAALALNKKGFGRGAGAMVGVVLEKHLSQVCSNHKIKMKKKHSTINEYNDELKNNDVIEMHDWKRIQHLAGLRNLCDHHKDKEPKQEEIKDLIDGVQKIIKTIS